MTSHDGIAALIKQWFWCGMDSAAERGRVWLNGSEIGRLFARSEEYK
jgi:hypothetical protein